MTLKLWPESFDELTDIAIARMKELDAEFRPNGDFNHYFYYHGYQDFDRWLLLSTKRLIRKKYDTLRSTV